MDTGIGLALARAMRRILVVVFAATVAVALSASAGDLERVEGVVTEVTGRQGSQGGSAVAIDRAELRGRANARGVWSGVVGGQPSTRPGAVRDRRFSLFEESDDTSQACVAVPNTSHIWGEALR